MRIGVIKWSAALIFSLLYIGALYTLYLGKGLFAYIFTALIYLLAGSGLDFFSENQRVQAVGKGLKIASVISFLMVITIVAVFIIYGPH